MKALLEHVVPNTDSSFARLSFHGRRFVCPYHSHPEVELLRIDASSGRCMVGDRLDTFAPGDFFIFGTHLPHLFANHTDSAAPAVSRYIQFRPDFLGRDLWNAPEMGGAKRLLDRAARGLRLSPAAARKIGPLFDQAHAAAGVSALSRLLVLLAALAETRATPLSAAPFREPQATADRLGKALDLMHSRFHDPIHLEEVARRAGLSPSAFSRLFHRRLGRTFQAHLLELRLGEVRRRLLTDTETSVAEIAFASGFNNLSNFNRLFRAAHGLPPREWRHNIKP